MRRATLLWAAALVCGATATAAAQRSTKNPHGKLQEECAVCHSSDTWVPAHVSDQFDHAKHGFALTGSHSQATCRSCHVSLDFHSTPSECASCHKDVHNGELGTNCATCHTPRNFLDRAIMVRAHQLTRFPLNGSHLTVDCTACHTPMPQGRMRFVNVSVQCVDCHLAQFQGAKNPDHVASGFSQECSTCHTPTLWTASRFASAAFNHNATRFPLTGAHLAVTCQQCHTSGSFGPLPLTCVSCHLTAYNGTNNPPHAAAGFPTTCDMCHTTSPGWAGAKFDHNTATKFPLTGAHVSVSCQQCHGDGVFVGKSTTCVSCHLAAYNGTNNPPHAAAGFPTTCETCHTTTPGWAGATVSAANHTFFLLPHHGAACSDCHSAVTTFNTFVCTNCHTQAATAPRHTAVSGYVWNSTNCYQCHKG